MVTVEDSMDSDVIRAEISLESVLERLVGCAYRLSEEKARGKRTKSVILSERDIVRHLEERAADMLRDLRLYKKARGIFL